jgi:hypothetical protein
VHANNGAVNRKLDFEFPLVTIDKVVIPIRKAMTPTPWASQYALMKESCVLIKRNGASLYETPFRFKA